jgi:hypothetical protein
MLAYYAHQHGNGHSNYAQIFARHSDYKIPVFTSSKFRFEPEVKVVFLPAEDPDGTGVNADIIPPPDYLHYSPVGQKSIQERSALFLNEMLRRSISMVIVDLSVEIAALCRAASIPYAYVRLPGNRSDPAHLQAYQGATFLLAYYPAELDGPEIPQWVKDKTIYTGFFSKFEKTMYRNPTGIPVVRVFTGNGGNSNLVNKLSVLAKRFKAYLIEVYGMNAIKDEAYSENISFKGMHPDPAGLMLDASVIVANCGLNLTSEILSLGRSFIAIPEERPYGEQYDMHLFLTSTRLAFDISGEWSLDQLAYHHPADLSRYINPYAPSLLLEWMQMHDFHPGALRKSLNEIKKPKILKTV